MRSALLALTLLAASACGGRDSAAALPSENEAERWVTADGPEPMTPAVRRATIARARAGDVEAMLGLAIDPARPGEARRWYAAAAEHGSCHAVRLLGDPGSSEGMSIAERRRWREEDRRRGCSVERWAVQADGGLYYGQPDNDLWQMRIGCANGRIEVAGPVGSTPSDSRQLFFRTSRGRHARRTRVVEYSGVAHAFTAGADDEVVSALLRGERVGASFFADAASWTIDGRGAAARLAPLLERCRG